MPKRASSPSLVSQEIAAKRDDAVFAARQRERSRDNVEFATHKLGVGEVDCVLCQYGTTRNADSVCSWCKTNRRDEYDAHLEGRPARPCLLGCGLATFRREGVCQFHDVFGNPVRDVYWTRDVTL